jgi:glycosyltransferase involved in cell wall biosynthesis
MPSIIIFCKTLLKGGAEKQAITLAKLLKERQNRIILISWCGDKIDAANLIFIEENSIEYIGLRGNPIFKFINFIKIIRKERISLVLSYLTLANFLTGIGKLFNRQLITIGGIRTEHFPFYKFIFEKFVHNYLNDATVFNNYSAKTKFGKRGFNPDKIKVIHNSINITVPKIVDNSSNEIRIISVCRFVRPKDFHTALHSFKVLSDNNINKELKYYIAGYGPMENEIRSLAGSLGLANKVVILINPPGIPEILKSCDIYLSTSLFEGLSNSIMEAMVAGLPVVATDVGDSRYLVRDGFNGFIVPCGNINMIAEKLDFLANSNNIRIDFGNNSYSIIGKEFSEDKLIDSYLKLISEFNFKEVKENQSLFL